MGKSLNLGRGCAREEWRGVGSILFALSSSKEKKKSNFWTAMEGQPVSSLSTSPIPNREKLLTALLEG